MRLVYLPDASAFFLWEHEDGARALPGVALFDDLGEQFAQSGEARLVLPAGVGPVAGRVLPLLETVARLAVVPASEAASLPASIACWTLASKLALALAARERMVPVMVTRDGTIEARWAAAISTSEDAAHIAAIAGSMPPSAHAVPVPGASSGAAREVWAPEALLRAFLDDAVDALVRTARGSHGPGFPKAAASRAGSRATTAGTGTGTGTSWERRWIAALAGEDRSFEPRGFAERTVVADLERWSRPALGGGGFLRACFRLELPVSDGDGDGQRHDDGARFALRFLLQSPEDPSLLVSAAEVWKTRGRRLAVFGRAFRDPQESLLEALGRAARIFAPIAASLSDPRPEGLALDATAAWAFLGQGAPALAEAGFGVLVPGELTAAGQRRLRLRLRVGQTTEKTKTAGAVPGVARLGLDEMLRFEWEAAIGDQMLTAREIAALARQKAPLVRYRGAWVAVDPRELAEIQKHLAETGYLPARAGLQAALAGEVRLGSMRVPVATQGAFAEALERLREGASAPASPPPALRATLRPYQERGLAWLATTSALGLGACLADDMGLGKTIQFLAFLLRRLELAPGDERPALLVAPTSVVGNWEREAERFAPDLRIVRHYGAERARSPGDVPRQPGTLVVTSYGLLRRDAALLAGVDWSTVALDEAQNIKNSAAVAARAARALRAENRIALTGTPVENRLAELWSILEFLNPGLLGPLETFRREYAVPIERYGSDEAAGRLRRIVGPFVLRRLKSDPAILQDLPPKNEMKVVCTLTREQATLYQAAVDEEMQRIEAAQGIERRGRVLALLMALKQICNHPAQYLGEAGPLPRRSGKLTRMTEMLEEVMGAMSAVSDRALVFTQFREMGDRITRHLGTSLGVEVAFLHGGTPRKARDEMVRRFQEDPHGPRIFVLSVKAGGTGLNLTAASHVFHFDRWWNPAVEDQATDRAHRIGQSRVVQVHKLICAGTIEEKIDHMVEQKRDLAARVVGAGERWITELDDRALRELFSLSQGASINDDGGEDGAGDDDSDSDDGDGRGATARRPGRARAQSPEVRA
jgi:superfamily II DNA or RNA helicase